MEHAQGDRHQARTPARVRIADGVVGLHRVGAGGEPGVEGAEQIRRHDGVGVDHHHRVRAALGDDRLEGVREREPLASALVVHPDEHPGAGGGGPRRRVVRAVVGHDHDLEEVAIG